MMPISPSSLLIMAAMMSMTPGLSLEKDGYKVAALATDGAIEFVLNSSVEEQKVRAVGALIDGFVVA